MCIIVVLTNTLDRIIALDHCSMVDRTVDDSFILDRHKTLCSMAFL